MCKREISGILSNTYPSWDAAIAMVWIKQTYVLQRKSEASKLKHSGWKKKETEILFMVETETSLEGNPRQTKLQFN